MRTIVTLLLFALFVSAAIAKPNHHRHWRAHHRASPAPKPVAVNMATESSQAVPQSPAQIIRDRWPGFDR